MTKPPDETVTVEEMSPYIRIMYDIYMGVKRIGQFLRPYSRVRIQDSGGQILDVLGDVQGFTDLQPDIGPLKLYLKREGVVGVVFGLVNGIIPGNISADFSVGGTPTYFFIRAKLSNPKARLVTEAEIVTGASATSYTTNDFSGNEPPEYAYFLLGYATDAQIVNTGRGNLEFHVITSHIYSDTELRVQYRIAIYRTG